MYSFLTKNGQTIAFVAGVVLSLMFVILVMTHDLTDGLGPESFQNKTPGEVADFSSKDGRAPICARVFGRYHLDDIVV